MTVSRILPLALLGLCAAHAAVDSAAASPTRQHVYLFPPASEPLREGFVRVINHSA